MVDITINKWRDGSYMAFADKDLVLVELPERKVVVLDDAHPLGKVQSADKDGFITADTADEDTLAEGVGSHRYGVLFPETIETTDPMVADSGVGHQNLVGGGLVAQGVGVVGGLSQLRYHSGWQNVTAVCDTTHVGVVTIGIDATENRFLWKVQGLVQVHPLVLIAVDSSVDLSHHLDEDYGHNCRTLG